MDLSKVVLALGELADEVIFVGGAINTILVDSAAKANVRATRDVDAVYPNDSYLAFTEFEDNLSRKGFVRAQGKDDPPCRWIYDSQILDVIPVKAVGPHATNRWFDEGVREASTVKIDAGRPIRILSPVYFIATKLDAFRSRGDAVNLLSYEVDVNHDLEDIIILIDGLAGIHQQLAASTGQVRSFIRHEFALLLKDSRLGNYIANCLPTSQNSERTERVLSAMQVFADDGFE